VRLALVNLGYLAASILFILTFKGLSHPRTAVRANLLGSVGMLVAVGATLLLLGRDGAAGYAVILGGMAVGSIIAVIITAHIAQSKRMRGQSQTVVIIHADAPSIVPYMSRAITRIHAHEASVIPPTSRSVRRFPC